MGELTTGMRTYLFKDVRCGRRAGIAVTAAAQRSNGEVAEICENQAYALCSGIARRPRQQGISNRVGIEFEPGLLWKHQTVVVALCPSGRFGSKADISRRSQCYDL
jgi:hypothetical protein